MQTNHAQYDPRENFLSLESDISFTNEDDDTISEDEYDDYDEIWVKYEDDEL